MPQCMLMVEMFLIPHSPSIYLLTLVALSKFLQRHHPQIDPFKVSNDIKSAIEDLATWLKAIKDELMFQLYEAQDRYKNM